MKLQQKAFTLVELIVVITILAILGTIAFISLQGYSASSRDSVRISDTGNMKTALELFHLNSGKYPLPDNYGTTEYSGSTLFYQGTFGENVVQSVSRNMTKVPLDPLTEREYIYSVSANKNELEILSLLEGDDVALNPLAPLSGGIAAIPQTNAAGITVTPRITGNYNGLFIKTSTHIVPLPSIINTEVEPLTVLTLDSENIKSMVTHLGENIPNHGNIVSNTGALTSLVLTGALNNLTKDSTTAEKAAVINIIKAAYVNETQLNTSGIIGYITNLATDDTTLASVFDTVVLNNTVVSTTPTITNSCDDTTKPADDLNKTYTVNPTSVNQIYVQDSTECGYTCDPGYTGVNCETAPFICGTSTVSAGGETYTTELISLNGGLYEECWTSQNMNHGTMLTNGSTMPSDTNTIEKWCYDNSSANCTADGGLYTWAEAMGFDASCNTINCTGVEDITKSVCGQLGTGWALPTDTQWTTLTTAGATGWLGNKLSGIISSLPGYRNKLAIFKFRTSNGYWWSSTEESTTYSWNRYLYSGNATVISNNNSKANGFSVVCIKN